MSRRGMGVGFVCPVAFLSVAVQFDELSPGRNDENKSGIVYMVSSSSFEPSKHILNGLYLNHSKHDLHWILPHDTQFACKNFSKYTIVPSNCSIYRDYNFFFSHFLRHF